MEWRKKMPYKFVRQCKLRVLEGAAGISGILLGLFVGIYTHGKGWGSRAKSLVNNPGFFPYIVAIGLILLGIALIFKSRTTDREKVTDINLLSFVLIAGWMVYAVLMNLLGFIVSSILVMVFTCVLWGISSKRIILLVSVLSPVMIYFIMVRILHVKFPTLF